MKKNKIFRKLFLNAHCTESKVYFISLNSFKWGFSLFSKSFRIYDGYNWIVGDFMIIVIIELKLHERVLFM